MKKHTLYRTVPFIIMLTIGLIIAGCTQPQKKVEQLPATPSPQTSMMGQGDPSAMMHSNPDAMQKAMSAPENRQAMIKMMSSPQMQSAMVDMMKDPAMQKSMAQTMSNPELRPAMISIMADPAMKDTFTAMVKDPRLAPVAREALK